MISGFEGFQQAGKDGLEVAVKSTDALTKGFGALAAESADYARQSLESGAKALEKLMAAGSLDKAVEVQTDYLRSAYEGYVSQATRISEIFTATARDAFKPYEALRGGK